jgi:hypothetical protein
MAHPDPQKFVYEGWPVRWMLLWLEGQDWRGRRKMGRHPVHWGRMVLDRRLWRHVRIQRVGLWVCVHRTVLINLTERGPIPEPLVKADFARRVAPVELYRVAAVEGL